MNKRPVVSFDFDGVLHQAVKVDQITGTKGNFRTWTYAPRDYYSCLSYHTHPLIIEKIHEESRKNDLVIVTGRKPEQGRPVLQYLRKLGLAKMFKGVYFSPGDKTEKLKSLGVKKHYEDSPKHHEAIRKVGGIEVIPVFPLSPKIFEPS